MNRVEVSLRQTELASRFRALGEVSPKLDEALRSNEAFASNFYRSVAAIIADKLRDTTADVVTMPFSFG